MIVLVIVVLALVVGGGLFREKPTYQPEPVDYLSLVVSVQQQGLTPVYPPALPAGWYAKDASFSPGDRPALDLALTTAEGRFAGLHQEDRAVDDLVGEYVGDDATEGDPVRLAGTVAPEWQTFSDPGGDHAFAAQVGEETVLVYGSADEAQLRSLVESLTTAPLAP